MADPIHDPAESTTESMQAQAAELGEQDLDAVAGGHVDENTSIWHDIGTVIRNVVDKLS